MGIDADAQRSAADERFVVRGKLGAGGMGVVYRVLDQAQQREVALKTLKAQSARDLFRFKREFRSLCDLAHPNLCSLYELHTTGEEWFFTMELIRGVGFIDWVRPSSGSDEPYLEGDGDDTGPRGSGPRSRTEILAATLNLERLELAFGQLCDGVYALHSAGKLHRDLKPSNVLCEPSGRVVLLDFGLVADVETLGVDNTHERAAVGTPAYMSPEQAADTPLTATSDWYAVGVILYEALTGRRPFEGRPDEVMRRKQHETPPRPIQLAPDTPPYLDALCMGLLSPDPRDRPGGRAVLEAMGREPSLATSTVQRITHGAPFVGRDEQLAALNQAMVDARRAGVAVLVKGLSGMGKSALSGRFLASLGKKPLILAGRCYEREAVPFKTLDTLIDALTSALMKLEPMELAGVLPRDVAALARLFPVLRRVPQIAEPEVRRFQPADPQELRRRAWSALRWMLGRLAATRPVVLCVDDLQWGDLDSAAFLGDLISRTDRPNILVLLLYRSEEEKSPVIAEIHKRSTTSSLPADLRVIDLPPLEVDDARELVRKLTAFDGDIDTWTESLVRDAGGNTLFLAELARSAGSAGGAPTLDELLRSRISRLPDDARALLTACSVAARPMSIEVAARAAKVADPNGPLAVLRAERLVRAGQGEGERLEPFHDRVRAAVVGDLETTELIAVHRGLVDAYSATVPTAHEALVDHLLGAGDPTQAAQHAVAAAAAAEEALAFRRASDLYGIALEYGDYGEHERRHLLRSRAVALVNAGQLLEAARMYQDASVGADPAERFELDRKRLEQVLRAGQLREGLDQARGMLAAIGYKLPVTRRASFISLLAQRAALRVRGLKFKERSDSEVDPEELRKVDVLWSISSGLSFANPISGRIVQAWHLRRSLALGEPRRIAAALAVEIGYVGLAGIHTAARVERLMARARQVAEKHGDPFHIGFVEAGSGLGHFLFGRWRLAHDHMEAGLRLMRDHGIDARWEIDITELFYLACLYYLGEIRDLTRWAPILLAEAQDRGDVYAQHGIRAWRSNLAWLAMGKPEDARAHVLAVQHERGNIGDFHLHDYYELISAGGIDLYVGDADGALARMEEAWPKLEASQLLRVQSVMVESWFLHGRAALACGHANRKQRPARVALARKCAEHLRTVPAAWSQALATLLDAGAAHVDGDLETAVRGYTDAEVRFRAADMRLFERSVRLARGEVVGGAGGASLRQDALEWMEEQAIVDPTAMSKVLVPR